MTCPTCSHTMQLFDGGDIKLFWCSRCGSMKVGQTSCEPSLVVRVRGMRAVANGGNTIDDVNHFCHGTGLWEAVYVPEDRPPESNHESS